MPRGNDSDAALVDLRGEFGASSGNAEDIIQASRTAYTPELRAAQMLERNHDVHAKLSDDWKSIEDKVGQPVLDFAVRGDKLIAIVESEKGRAYPTVHDLSNFLDEPVRGRRGQAVGQAEPYDPGEDDVRERHIDRMRAQAESARLAQEAEAAAAEARAKATERAQADRAKAEEKAESERTKASEKRERAKDE